jgi:hypothetical protein
MSGRKACGLGDRLGPVGGFPDNRKALRLQQRSGGPAKVLVIIDDQYGRPHGLIIADGSAGRIVGTTNPARTTLHTRNLNSVPRFPEVAYERTQELFGHFLAMLKSVIEQGEIGEK